jgi:hypothetical protein
VTCSHRIDEEIEVLVIRERMNALPFVVEGHMTCEYDEVYEI